MQQPIEMTSVRENEIGWKTVPNTVRSRLMDDSLVHKLVPSRKLRRRTKVLNAMLDELPRSRTYNQYVESKTTVLRELSEDSDTDDANSFAEEDYSIIYKTNVSLRNYKVRICKRKVQFGNIEVKECIAPVDALTKKPGATTRASKPKTKTTQFVNLGWRSVRRKRKGSSSFISDQTDSVISEFDILNHRQSSTLDCTNTPATKPRFIAFSNALPLYQESTRADSKEIKRENRSKVGVNDHSTGVAKDYPVKLVNFEHNALSTETAASSSKETTKIQSTLPIVQKDICRKAQISAGSAKQPKDSGIDEDSEEESSEDGKRTSVDKSKKISCRVEWNTQTLSLTTRDQDKNDTACEDTDPVKAWHSQNTANTDESVDDRRQPDDGHEHKLQPVVTCTEIVNKRYKIVTGELPLPDVGEQQDESKFEKRFSCAEVPVKQETEENVEDSMSPISKRRLRQLKRLNLTVDSESSSSEEDGDADDVRRRSSPDPSSKICIEKTNDRLPSIPDQFDTENQAQLVDLEDERRVNNDHENQLHINWNRSESEVASQIKELTTLSRSKKSLRKKRTSLGSLAEENESRVELVSSGASITASAPSCCYSKDVATPRTRSIDEMESSLFAKARRKNDPSDKDKDPKLRRKSQDVVADSLSLLTVVPSHKRPRNLQELMAQGGKGEGEEELIDETYPASFEFKDVLESDIFILEIPKTVHRRQLLGKKLILTKNKLKLGKQKYKIKYNDAKVLSCVFATGKSSKPYKIANINPLARIVACKKISNDSLASVSKQSRSDGDNFAVNDCVDEITSSARRCSKKTTKQRVILPKYE